MSIHHTQAIFSLNNHSNSDPAQWLGGRELDSRLRGSGFQPHRCHCVVVLEQEH